MNETHLGKMFMKNLRTGKRGNPLSCTFHKPKHLLDVKHVLSVSRELPHARVALVLKHLPVLPGFNTRDHITNQRFFPLVYRTEPVPSGKQPGTVSAALSVRPAFGSRFHAKAATPATSELKVGADVWFYFCICALLFLFQLDDSRKEWQVSTG